MSDIQGTEPEPTAGAAPVAPSLLRRKGVVTGAAVVAVLGAGTVIAVTSSGSAKHASVNSLPGTTVGAPAVGSGDTDTYVAFQTYQNGYLPSETTSTVSSPTLPVTEVVDPTFDIAQTLNIGSQSSGAGAGKVTFNPLKITLPVDKNTPTLLQMAASGSPFKSMQLFVKPTGLKLDGPLKFPNPNVPITYNFKLAAIKTIAFSGDQVDVTFEYGGLQMLYRGQSPDGSLKSPPVISGWNRVKNVQDTDPSSTIQ